MLILTLYWIQNTSFIFTHRYAEIKKIAYLCHKNNLYFQISHTAKNISICIIFQYNKKKYFLYILLSKALS